jgi:hypothetical protein
MADTVYRIYDNDDEYLGEDTGPDEQTVVIGYNDVVTEGPRALYAVPADQPQG